MSMFGLSPALGMARLLCASVTAIMKHIFESVLSLRYTPPSYFLELVHLISIQLFVNGEYLMSFYCSHTSSEE